METAPSTPVASRAVSGVFHGGMNGHNPNNSVSQQNISGNVHHNGTPPSQQGNAYSQSNIDTPKGPPLSRVATSVPGVHVAQYSNVDVVELDIGAHTVMRRVSNGSVNATQILKVAGLDRSRRQKALERDIGPRFEIIQGGTGKYQGTWIPMEDAINLAKTHGVYDLLQPLFDFDMASRPQLRNPTRFEMDERRRELVLQNSQGTPSASAVAAAAAAAATVPHQHQKMENQNSEGSNCSNRGQATFNDNNKSNDNENNNAVTNGDNNNGNNENTNDNNNKNDHVNIDNNDRHNIHNQPCSNGQRGNEQTNNVNRFDSFPMAAHAEMSTATAADQTMDESIDEFSTLPPLDPHEGDALAELSREAVTELFLSANRGETKLLSEILAQHGTADIEPDVPIDDAGHTALHWAAALGKVPLAADLVNHGANCRRGNRKGESPLVRAVLVTNSSDNQTFGELLDLLFPCLHLGDAQGRTVLHHIALTAGIPGRSDASRYYLDALLEWAVRCRGASGVKWLVDEIVDAQDMNGDTALNIAARLGSTRIAQQLVEIGAATWLPNRAGLRPADFGVVAKSHAGQASRHFSNDNDPTNMPAASLNRKELDGSSNATASGYHGELSDNGTRSSTNDSSHTNSTASLRGLTDATSSATSIPVANIKEEFKTHSRSGSRAPIDGGEKRQELANECNNAIKMFDERLSRELATKERTLQIVHARLKDASKNLDGLLAREASLQEVNEQFERAKERVKALEAAAVTENEKFNAESKEHFSAAPIPQASFDADQPFRVKSDSELSQLPPILLQARIAAYRQNEQQLIELRNELRMSSLDGEAKYRKVVAQCTSSELSKVDEILEDLLAAVVKEPKDQMDVE